MATSRKKKQTKTAFVLSLPSDLPIAEVITRGKKAGLSLSQGYVSNIRSAAKARKGGKSTKKGAGPRAKRAAGKAVAAAKTPRAKTVGRPVTSRAHGERGAESTLKRMVIELGPDRAQALIAEVRRRLATMLSSL
jgi:hypothetical protein